MNLLEALQTLEKEDIEATIDEKICEDKETGEDLAEYQKWVDYDMKKYGKISEETQRKVKDAGLEIIKDQYGDYEVIAKEDDGIDESCVTNESCSEKKLNEGTVEHTPEEVYNKLLELIANRIQYALENIDPAVMKKRFDYEDFLRTGKFGTFLDDRYADHGEIKDVFLEVIFDIDGRVGKNLRRALGTAVDDTDVSSSASAAEIGYDQKEYPNTLAEVGGTIRLYDRPIIYVDGRLDVPVFGTPSFRIEVKRKNAPTDED